MLVAAVPVLAFLTTQALPASVVVQERPKPKNEDMSSPSKVVPLDNLKSPSPTNPLLVHCDGYTYGRGLHVASCHDVFNYIPQNDTQTVFAERRSGVYHDISLPMRIMSSDGKCFIQPLLAEGVSSGRASAMELGSAAFTLLHTCVIEKGIGGIAANIGGDENMWIAIADYSLNVRCDRGPVPGPPQQSCFHIFHGMKATKDWQVFGNRGDPGVEVNLPVYHKAVDARCMIKIGINGQATRTSWYELWAAVKAIYSMCVRAKEKGGKASRIGLRKNKFVELSDEHPDAVWPININSCLSYESSDANAATLTFELTSPNPVPFLTQVSLERSNNSSASLLAVAPDDIPQIDVS